MIQATGIYAIPLVIIILATGLLPFVGLFPVLAGIIGKLYLFGVLIIAAIIVGKYIPGVAKIAGFLIIATSGLIGYFLV